MKNLFTTFVVLIFSVNATAQKEVSREQVRLALAESMVSFVTSVRPAFTVGMSYDQFQNALVGTSNPTVEGVSLLRKSHEYLANKTAYASILQNYQGKEMSVIYAKVESLKTNKGMFEGKDVFSTSDAFNPFDNKSNGTIKCRWYDLQCHLIKLYMLVVYGGVPCEIADFGDYPCH